LASCRQAQDRLVRDPRSKAASSDLTAPDGHRAAHDR
jgi:hypothetical protein